MSQPKNVRDGMRGIYQVTSLAGYAYLRLTDLLLGLRQWPRGPMPGSVRQVLVGIGGHLGDGIMATGVFPAIERAFPGVGIGLAAPSWTTRALEAHPRLRRVHEVDHWKLNRAPLSWYEKFTHSRRTHRAALEEIRAAGYDVAIDLYPFYPTMAILFAQAGIPVRIGFESGGGGPAYTRPLVWENNGAHMMQKQLGAVAELTGEPGEAGYDWPPSSPGVEQQVTQLCANAGVSGRVVILHPGTGDPLKAWPPESWLEVARTLLADGRCVVITGAGASERMAAEWMRMHEPRIIDLCGHTSIEQLAALFRRARVVVAPDSAAGHIAAAVHTPVVSIMSSISDPAQWRPLSDAGETLTPAGPWWPGASTARVERDVVSVHAVIEASMRLSDQPRHR